MSTVPTLYQYRLLATWEGGKWSDWIPCTEGKARECKQTPVREGWQYEVRALFDKSPEQAVEEFKEALNEHFNEFKIPTKLSIASIMKHIEKVFKERTK